MDDRFIMRNEDVKPPDSEGNIEFTAENDFYTLRGSYMPDKGQLGQDGRLDLHLEAKHFKWLVLAPSIDQPYARHPDGPAFWIRFDHAPGLDFNDKKSTDYFIEMITVAKNSMQAAWDWAMKYFPQAGKYTGPLPDPDDWMFDPHKGA